MQLTRNDWDKKSYNEFADYLLSIGSEKLANFAAKLIPTKYKIIGINSKEIKRIIKEISAGDFEGFIKISEDKYYEQLGILGGVIAACKCTEERRKSMLLNYLTLIDNWALNDSLCASLKIVAKHKEFYYNFIIDQLKGDCWHIRFGLCMLMGIYLADDNYIDDILAFTNNVKDTHYYVQMMQAWLIAESFIKQREKTLAFLKNNKLSKTVQNKAIQKIRESFRVSTEDKELVKTLKK